MRLLLTVQRRLLSLWFIFSFIYALLTPIQGYSIWPNGRYGPVNTAGAMRRPRTEANRIATIYGYRSFELTQTLGDKESDGIDQYPVPSKENCTAIRRKIDNDFLHVSAPAFFSLAAEPLVSLIDTSYIGRLGAIQQAGK